MATDTTDGELGYVLDLLQPRCDERVQNCVALTLVLQQRTHRTLRALLLQCGI
jgi:hypothetical protein